MHIWVIRDKDTDTGGLYAGSLGPPPPRRGPAKCTLDPATKVEPQMCDAQGSSSETQAVGPRDTFFLPG